MSHTGGRRPYVKAKTSPVVEEEDIRLRMLKKKALRMKNRMSNTSTGGRNGTKQTAKTSKILYTGWVIWFGCGYLENMGSFGDS